MKRNPQGGAKLLVTIVDRGKGDQISMLLGKKYTQVSFVTMAEGTVGSDLMDLLGLDTADKDMVLTIAPGGSVKAMMDDLSVKRFIWSAGKGIAFSIRLSGIGSLLHTALENFSGETQIEGDKTVNETEKNSLIIVISDPGFSDQIMEHAKNAGASGGTVLNARGLGGENVGRFLGITIQDEKEIITILTDSELRMPIMSSINEAFGPRADAKALLLSVPVEDMVRVG